MGGRLNYSWPYCGSLNSNPGAFYIIHDRGYLGSNGGQDWDNFTFGFNANRCSNMYQDSLTEVRLYDLSINFIIKF